MSQEEPVAELLIPSVNSVEQKMHYHHYCLLDGPQHAPLRSTLVGKPTCRNEDIYHRTHLRCLWGFIQSDMIDLQLSPAKALPTLMHKLKQPKAGHQRVVWANREQQNGLSDCLLHQWLHLIESPASTVCTVKKKKKKDETQECCGSALRQSALCLRARLESEVGSDDQ